MWRPDAVLDFGKSRHRRGALDPPLRRSERLTRVELSASREGGAPKLTLSGRKA
jgi:hypothetical protein